jgi:hypothetical protein
MPDQFAGDLCKVKRTSRQHAALPLKIQNGETLVMLMTSQETWRWALPKG